MQFLNNKQIIFLVYFLAFSKFDKHFLNMKENFTFKTSQNNNLQISAYLPQKDFNNKCLIYAHGFKGFKDWGFVPYAAEYFSGLGYLVLTFNFSHNGIGTNPLEFTELEKFSQNTISLEVSELLQLINAVKENNINLDFQISKIGLIGHSRGGGVSILAASQNKNVNALVTWSAVSKLDRFTERQKEEWKTKGYMEVKNTRTNQVYRMNYSYLADILKNKNGLLSLKSAAEKLDIPWLIIHGKNDLTVKIDEAEELFEWSGKNKTKFIVIPDTGHTFGAQHPFTGPGKAFKIVLRETEKFFAQNM